MEDVAGVHAEILVSGNAVTFNILDEGNKPVPTSGFTGSILVVSGSERETVTLSPVGASAMKAETKKPVVPGSSITLILKTQAGTTGQAKFKN
jgi:nitrogen fixation protein FixH